MAILLVIAFASTLICNWISPKKQSQLLLVHCLVSCLLLLCLYCAFLHQLFFYRSRFSTLFVCLFSFVHLRFEMQMCNLVWVYEWPSKISTKHTNFTLCLSPSNSKCHSPQITGEIFSIVSLSSVFTLSFSFAVFFIDNTVFDMFHSDFAQFEQAPTHLFASFIICCDISDFHKINYSRELFSYSYSSSCCCCCCCWRWWYFLLLRFSFVQFFSVLFCCPCLICENWWAQTHAHTRTLS